MDTTSWAKSESARSQRWNHFPNSTIARYDQLTQTITLNEITYADFVSASTSDDPLEERRVLPLLWHEIRHWIDHVTTVWGQSDLISGFAALEARAVGTEQDYWKIVQYYDQAIRDRFTTYYSTINKLHPPDGTERKWSWELSTGARFDHLGRPDETLPIIFTKFRWMDGSLACRVPLSVASLLETSAMHFELLLRVMYLKQLSEEAQTIQTRVLNEEISQYLYNPEVAEYSVAAHLVANQLHLSDPLVAFRLASSLSYLCLNLTEELFDNFVIPERFESWGARNVAFISQRDRGFAFLLLAVAAPEFRDGDDLRQWLERAVLAAGLPPLAEIESRSNAFKNQSPAKIVSGRFSSRLHRLIQSGNELSSLIGFDSSPMKAISAVSHIGYPDIIFADLDALIPGNHVLYSDASHFHKWLSNMTDLIWSMSDFIEACGM